jgi:hypothetical protein
MSKSDRDDNKNKATVTTTEAKAAAAAAAAAATKQSSVMTIQLANNCNQKTTTWRHSQWHRGQLH